LRENYEPKVQPLELAEALESLRQRSLIEKKQGLFMQQPMVREYIREGCVAKTEWDATVKAASNYLA
jgi:hypothetical protein